MARKYYWCDYPTGDADGKCLQPAHRLRSGLCRCERHAARLPYWPTGDDASTPPTEERAQTNVERLRLKFKHLSGGGVVVCDGETHTYSRMRFWPKRETFVGTAECWCQRATPEQLASWAQVDE